MVHHLLQITSVDNRMLQFSLFFFYGFLRLRQAMSNEQRQGLLEFTTGAFTVQGGDHGTTGSWDVMGGLANHGGYTPVN